MQEAKTKLPEYSVEWGKAPLVDTVAWLSEGDFCACYLVNSAYVFRFAKHDAASKAARIERSILPLLQNRATVQTPLFLFGGKSDRTGQQFVGYRLLSGAPLDDTILKSMPLEEQTVFISQIADFCRQLHAVPVEQIALINMPVLDPGRHFSRIMAQARSTIRPRLVKLTWQYYEDLLSLVTQHPDFHSYTPALLHGDLSPDHILADTAQTRISGVIDFGDACIGDPAWDFIYIREDYSPSTLHAVLQHYDAENAQRLERRVSVYQHLNNVDYALSAAQLQDEQQITEALAILEEQAAEG